MLHRFFLLTRTAQHRKAHTDSNLGDHRGGRGGGRGGHGSGPGGEREKPKKENILDLGKYMDKKITVKFTGGREGWLRPKQL
jgi:U6 snRNA-associated Sm-like protein LSm7